MAPVLSPPRVLDLYPIPIPQPLDTTPSLSPPLAAVASAPHELSLTRDLSLSPKNASITGGQRANRALTFTMYDE